jgi:hypothetical protein
MKGVCRRDAREHGKCVTKLSSLCGCAGWNFAERLLNRNKYGFSLQYDSEYSKRGTVDANVAVLKPKLADRDA